MRVTDRIELSSHQNMRVPGIKNALMSARTFLPIIFPAYLTFLNEIGRRGLNWSGEQHHQVSR